MMLTMFKRTCAVLLFTVAVALHFFASPAYAKGTGRPPTSFTLGSFRRSAPLRFQQVSSIKYRIIWKTGYADDSLHTNDAISYYGRGALDGIQGTLWGEKSNHIFIPNYGSGGSWAALNERGKWTKKWRKLSNVQYSDSLVRSFKKKGVARPRSQKAKPGAQAVSQRTERPARVYFPYSGHWTGPYHASLTVTRGIVFAAHWADYDRRGTWRMSGSSLILTSAPIISANARPFCNVYKFTPHSRGAKMEMFLGTVVGEKPVPGTEKFQHSVVLDRQWTD